MSDHSHEKITNRMLALVGEICLELGRIKAVSEFKKMSAHLRKNNQIKTIQGTLAIEGNTLSLEQVTAVINGKRVLGTMREVQEVTHTRNWKPIGRKFVTPHNAQDGILLKEAKHG
ncbi:MAG: Fic family protein [Alphaproteobacteria bacterium]|nr:Fic family protein [Alphaproteobacteria bacterium]